MSNIIDKYLSYKLSVMPEEKALLLNRVIQVNRVI